MAIKILMVGSEMVPYAATGGLGDVLGSLPAACIKASGGTVDMRVIMPLYGSIDGKYREQMTFLGNITVPLSWRKLYCGVFSLEKDGVTVYFIDNEYYFKRPDMYGNYDDGERFAFFGSAVMHVLGFIDFVPDILHAHDWQSALSVIYLKTMFANNPDYSKIRAVFTIHNVAYQGKYDPAILGDVFGLDNKYYSAVENDGCINLMKGAIALADRVTTVSPTYAEELKYPEYSHGMHYILNRNAYKFSGILNGIDYDYYNPETDTSIEYRYSAENITGKSKNKTALQKELGLNVDKKLPLIAVISRLADHKGIDLITGIIEDVLNYSDAQLVVLGKGERRYEEFFERMAANQPKKVKALIMYDKEMSKKIYASSDIFLMPSQSEPCGLAQMIASRYGSVPVTRETGGLYDSIKGYYEFGGEIYGNGFTFRNYNMYELKDRIFAALALYKDPEKWERLVKRIMNIDFSWNVSAKNYVEMYKNLC